MLRHKFTPQKQRCRSSSKARLKLRSESRDKSTKKRPKPKHVTEQDPEAGNELLHSAIAFNIRAQQDFVKCTNCYFNAVMRKLKAEKDRLLHEGEAMFALNSQLLGRLGRTKGGRKEQFETVEQLKYPAVRSEPEKVVWQFKRSFVMAADNSESNRIQQRSLFRNDEWILP